MTRANSTWGRSATPWLKKTLSLRQWNCYRGPNESRAIGARRLPPCFAPVGSLYGRETQRSHSESQDSPRSIGVALGTVPMKNAVGTTLAAEEDAACGR